MTFQQMYYVIEAARLGSINRVAQENHIVQSSVSVEIRNLEDELGIKLFERHNKGVRPTQEGMNFISYACAMLTYRDQVISRFKTDGKPELTKLSISSQRYAYTAEAFVDFFNMGIGEDYSFKVQEQGFLEVIEDVAAGVSEIGVVFLSQSTQKLLLNLIHGRNLQFTELIKLDQVVIFGAGHPLAGKDRVESWELEDYPYVTFSNDTNDLSEAINLLGYKKPNRSIVVSDRATACAILARTCGYTLGSGALLKGHPREDLVARPVSGLDNPCIIGWIKRADVEMTAAMTAFVEQLEKYSARQAREAEK